MAPLKRRNQEVLKNNYNQKTYEQGTGNIDFNCKDSHDERL